MSYGRYINGTLTFGSKRNMEAQQNSMHLQGRENQNDDCGLPYAETSTMNIIIPTPSMTTRVKEHEVITEAREKTTGFPRASHDVGSTDELYSTMSTQKEVFNLTTDLKV